MEKNSKRNEKIHKNVGLFKGAIERKANQEIRKKEYNLKRPLTAQEKAKVRHKVAHNFKTQLAVKVGAVSLVGLTIFSTGKMLGEGSGKVEGVTQENSESVTVDANKFKESIKVVGLGDEGVLLVQDENGQDVQITNQNVNDIKAKNDLNVQREAERKQIRDEIKNISSATDTLEYMKKFYKEQYAKNIGKELAGNISIEFFNRDNNPETIEEILVKKANGETIDSWNGTENENSTLSEITGPLMMIEDMRKEYVRNANCNEYLGKEGGKKDQLSNVIIRVNGLEDNQKSEGFEPGE